MANDENEPWPAVKRLADQIDCRTILDVGAHQGGMTRWFLETFPQAQIFAFEPDPRNYDKLVHNLDGEDRAHLAPFALSSETGSSEFFIGINDYTSSLFPRETESRRYYNRQYEMESSTTVLTETLDNLFAEKVDKIDILKMDTQGGELNVLRGAEKLLRDGSISIIVSEFFFIPHYHGVPLLNETWTHLRERGYELFDLFKGPKGQNGQARFGDAIFVSPQFRRDVLDAMPPED